MQLSGDVPKSLIDFAGETIYDKSDISGYVFGGAEDFEACKLSNKLYSFKIEEDEINFTEIKALDSKLPSARSGSSLSTRQAKKLFVIGGMDEMAYNLDIWIANVDQNQVKWENIAINGSNPEGRYTHKTVLLGNKHVLLGGGNAMWSASFDYLTTFDPVAKEFILIETKPDQTHGFPIARKFHAVDQYENEVYLIGGCKAISTESKEVC
uniref:Uncharacterized protein n=1 Tax=Acrobeloides nanus TaxID=290746 RepID=A0A914BY87_9BILA